MSTAAPLRTSFLFLGQVPPLLASVPRNPDGPRQIHRFPHFLIADFSLSGQRLPATLFFESGQSAGRLYKGNDSFTRNGKKQDLAQIPAQKGALLNSSKPVYVHGLVVKRSEYSEPRWCLRASLTGRHLWPWWNLSPAANWPRIGQNRISILSNPRIFL